MRTRVDQEHHFTIHHHVERVFACATSVDVRRSLLFTDCCTMNHVKMVKATQEVSGISNVYNCVTCSE